MELVEVIIWNQLVGVIIYNETNNTSTFEYANNFLKTGLQLSPLIHPLSSKIIKANANDDRLGNLSFDTNKGLPLFIADSLPDKFGTELFAKYLEKEGKNYRNLTPIEKLTYIGNRGMGALEFKPAKHNQDRSTTLDLKKLNKLSTSLLNDKPVANLADIGNLFHVGTSPGGAQPKVLINIDKETGDIYRGDNAPLNNQESWILKFNRDIGQPSDKEKGKIEYGYYLMAKDAGIPMMESKLMEIDGEFFFMTKRFDRINGEKLHTQTLHAIAGMNFMLSNTYSYEQTFSVINQLNLGYPAKEQLFRMMVFNIISRNVDDHTKNFGFNMNKEGKWSMSPAYDITFTYNDNFNRETPHFLSVNGKNKNIRLKDILTVAEEYSIKHPKQIINEVNKSLSQWYKLAKEIGISMERLEYIGSKINTTNYILK